MDGYWKGKKELYRAPSRGKLDLPGLPKTAIARDFGECPEYPARTIGLGNTNQTHKGKDRFQPQGLSGWSAIE